jgi:hypothetical protein
MPFRVPGLEVIDTRSLLSPGPVRQSVPFQKGAEMASLNDPILAERPAPEGIEIPPLTEPEWLGGASPYVASSGATVMTSAQLADERSAVIPDAPHFNRHGQRVSHTTDRFVLGGSMEGYRIWRFQSPEPPIEFPVSAEGWALAWTTFRRLESQAA